MTARFIVADVFDGLATLETGSVDLVITSPPFLALRSYLPAGHPDKSKEIGSEATPAEFIDVMLKVTAELRRVLAPHGSICIELGDTYAGSGGAGGDYTENGLREGQPRFRQGYVANDGRTTGRAWTLEQNPVANSGGTGWPFAKSRTLIPQLYEIALAYGINPLTGQSSPAGQWRIRNVVTWARPNPPVGALGDKWRPATSDLIVACTSGKRYWDDLATRKEHQQVSIDRALRGRGDNAKDQTAPPDVLSSAQGHGGNGPAGAPLLDYWVIPPGGYQGAHYAVFPEELVAPCVKAMCPEKVCRVCGEPSRRIVEKTPEYAAWRASRSLPNIDPTDQQLARNESYGVTTSLDNHDDKGARGELYQTAGWTDCGHGDWRPGLVLDPFAGSGTTLAVATGHGHDAIGIDIDQRNLELTMDRVGPFLMEIV